MHKEVSLENSNELGYLLRKKREDLDLTLPEIEKRINLRKKYILALENGQYDNLPSDIYVQAFIRSYAKALDLAGDDLIILYKKQKSEYNGKQTHNDIKTHHSKRRDIRYHQLVVLPKVIKSFVLFVIVALFLGYLGVQVRKVLSSPPLIIESPNTNTVINENSIEVRGRTDREIEVFINDSEVLADSDGGFVKQVNLNSGVNIIEVKVKNRHGRSTTDFIKVFVGSNTDENAESTL